jgi:hypothetical protein
VNEIEMPAEQVVPRGPPSITWSLLPNDPRAMSDKEIYAPLTEAETKGKEEAARLKESQIKDLIDKTKDWGEDQTFAVSLLEGILQHTNAPDPRGVVDAIRTPILHRLERWLRAVDKQRLDACAADPPGFAATSRGKFQGNDPCESWFRYEDTRSHGPSELQALGMSLNLLRFHSADEAGTAAIVQQGVLEYRKLTDPHWLEQKQQAAELVGGLTALAGAAGQKFGPRPAVPAAAGKSQPSGKFRRDDSVWVQLKDGRPREFKPSEIKGSLELGAKVRTVEGRGTVVARGEPPDATAVEQPPLHPLNVKPSPRPIPPAEPRVTNPKHHPSSASPEPVNVDKLYQNSIMDKDGVRWAKDADGTIHRFSRPSAGERHWNGSTGGVDPIDARDIPIEIRRQLHFEE